MVRRHIPKSVKELFPRMRRQRVSDNDIARYTSTSARTVRRVIRLHQRTGNVVQTPIVDGRPRRLSNHDAEFLVSCLLRRPELLVRELRHRLYRHRGIRVSDRTILRTLWRFGITRKKLTQPAAERDEEDRELYQWVVGVSLRADQLVFVDETGADRRTAHRKFGWGQKGGRVFVQRSSDRGKHYSILPALSIDGILHCVVIRDAFTNVTFNDFIRGLLDVMQPFPGRNSVIVMDNASIHKSAELREMIEARGMRLLYLPSYSPDLNPIEEAFSSVKAWLRRNSQYVSYQMSGLPGTDPVHMLLTAVYSITAEKARGWFRHANYI